MRGAKGFPSIHGPEAKVHLGAPAGIADRLGDEGGGQQIQCHTHPAEAFIQPH